MDVSVQGTLAGDRLDRMCAWLEPTPTEPGRAEFQPRLWCDESCSCHAARKNRIRDERFAKKERRRAGRRSASGSRCGADRGMVTVELAIGILGVTVVTIFLVWCILLGVTKARCQESASQVARYSARGDESAAQRASDAAPAGAKVVVRRDNGDLWVEVTATVSFFGVGGVHISADSRYPIEPGVK